METSWSPRRGTFCGFVDTVKMPFLSPSQQRKNFVPLQQLGRKRHFTQCWI